MILYTEDTLTKRPIADLFSSTHSPLQNQTFMNYPVPTIILVVLFLAVTACSPKQKTKLNKTGQLHFKTILKEQYSSIQKKQDMIITKASAWESLWEQMHKNVQPMPSLPKVDFSQEMLIGVFMGTKSTGGYDINIQSIKETESEIVVTVKEIFPRNTGFVSTALTQPTHVVKLLTSKKKVVFVRKAK